MKNLTLLLMFISMVGCAVNPVTGTQDFVLITENEEIAMGREYNAQMLKKNSIYQDKATKFTSDMESMIEDMLKSTKAPKIRLRR